MFKRLSNFICVSLGFCVDDWWAALLWVLLGVSIGVGAASYVEHGRLKAVVAEKETVAARCEQKITQKDLDAAYAINADLAEQLQKEKDYADQRDKAARAAQARNFQLTKAAAANAAAIDSLYTDLAQAQSNAASASRDALVEYGTTAGAVYGECAKRYTEMAGKAQGHANDVQTCREAWRK